MSSDQWKQLLEKQKTKYHLSAQKPRKQHEHSHCVFLPLFPKPQLITIPAGKRQIEFNMRLDSHELVQTEVFMNSMQASATTRDWGHYRKSVCLFTLANTALRLKLLSP